MITFKDNKFYLDEKEISLRKVLQLWMENGSLVSWSRTAFGQMLNNQKIEL
jgi:hypothetical protein